MLVAAAICPPTPMLVPEVARPSPGMVAVRRACAVAVHALLDSAPDLVVVVAAADPPRTTATASTAALEGDASLEWDASAGGSLAGYGVAVTAGGDRHLLPTAHTIGAWLLDQAESPPSSELAAVDRGAARPTRRYLAIPAGEPPESCRAEGARLAAAADRVALLVMGDGSARRSDASPGPFHPQALAADAGVYAALTTPDPAALLRLDTGWAEELWIGGRVAWQALAGAAEAPAVPADRTPAVPADRTPALPAAGTPVVTTTAGLHSAPYGVGYFVVFWTTSAA